MSTEEERHAAEARRFGENLGAVRRRRDVSQDELARRMAAMGHKWHPSTVARLEAGERRATWMEVRDLAGILEVNMDRFTWAPAEEAEAAFVASTAATLRKAADDVRIAIATLLAARHVGRLRADERRGSQYERVRNAVHDLDGDLETATLDAAIAAGEALWEKERNA